MKTQNKYLLVFASLILAALLAGCGNSTAVAPPPPPAGPDITVTGSAAIPGNGSFIFKNLPGQTAHSLRDHLWDWELTPAVHAQTPAALTMIGNYSGFCPRTVVAFPTNLAPYMVIFYGAGTLDLPGLKNGADCTNSFTTDSTPVIAASDAPVFGDGALQGLAARRSKDSFVLRNDGGRVDVWVVRNDVFLATPISCTLGLENRCTNSVDTFPVLDGDGIVVTLTINPGEDWREVQFFLGKQ